MTAIQLCLDLAGPSAEPQVKHVNPQLNPRVNPKVKLLPRGWTQEDYDKGYALAAAGHTCTQIGDAINKSKDAIVGVSHRWNWPKRARPDPAPKPAERPVERAPLPPGHPVTWGLISNGAHYPGAYL